MNGLPENLLMDFQKECIHYLIDVKLDNFGSRQGFTENLRKSIGTAKEQEIFLRNYCENLQGSGMIIIYRQAIVNTEIKPFIHFCRQLGAFQRIRLSTAEVFREIQGNEAKAGTE